MSKDLRKFKEGEFCLDPKKDTIGQILVNSPETLSIRWLPENIDQNIILGHLSSKALLRLSRLKKLDITQYSITLSGLPTTIVKVETFENEELNRTSVYLKSLCFEKFEGKITEEEIFQSIPLTIIHNSRPKMYVPACQGKYLNIEILSKQKSSILKTLVNFYY